MTKSRGEALHADCVEARVPRIQEDRIDALLWGYELGIVV